MSIVSMSNTTYDRMKHLVQVVLPAVGALYFGLASIWNLPNAEQVTGTIVVLCTFLGVTLKISNDEYQESDERYSGVVRAVKEPGEPLPKYQLVYDGDPAEIYNEDEITLKVFKMERFPGDQP